MQSKPFMFQNTTWRPHARPTETRVQTGKKIPGEQLRVSWGAHLHEIAEAIRSDVVANPIGRLDVPKSHHHEHQERDQRHPAHHREHGAKP